ncbi:MAG: hypothetical protein H7Y38_01925 [Armatimonadetes bacterium]|nr:hypothetical protein [Armatimonadota bacterium]
MTETAWIIWGAGFLLLCILAPFVSRAVCRAFELVKPNFAGATIPAATGLTFLLVGAITYGAVAATGATLGMVYAPAFLLVCAGFGILGLLDDKFGSREVGGFRGHIGALLRGKPTTGSLKLIGGGLLALCAAFLVHRTDWLSVVLTASLIALGANTLNLFDTRPGRAQFGFFVLFALPVMVSALLALYALRYNTHGFLPDDVRYWTPPGVLLAPLVFAVIAEWWSDATGKTMMGDTGSNLLGATGALAAAVTLPLWGNLVLLAVLLAVNVAAERVSLNAAIERNRFLRAFDRALGKRAK